MDIKINPDNNLFEGTTLADAAQVKSMFYKVNFYSRYPEECFLVGVIGRNFRDSTDTKANTISALEEDLQQLVVTRWGTYPPSITQRLNLAKIMRLALIGAEMVLLVQGSEKKAAPLGKIVTRSDYRGENILTFTCSTCGNNTTIPDVCAVEHYCSFCGSMVHLAEYDT